MEALLPNVPMTFVVDGHRVSGFVTPSDLNRHPARAHFYLLLADLEMALARLVRGHFADLDDALALLHPQSQGVVRARFAADVKNDVETDVVTGMDLSHLLRVVGLTAELRARLGAHDEETWHAWTGGLRSLRDAVDAPCARVPGSIAHRRRLGRQRNPNTCPSRACLLAVGLHPHRESELMGDIKLFRYGPTKAIELEGKTVVIEKTLQTLMEKQLDAFLGVHASRRSTPPVRPMAGGSTHSGSTRSTAPSSSSTSAR